MLLKNPKCKNCQGRKTCQDEAVSWIFVIIGLLATVSIRLVTVLMNFNETYGKIAWYIGVVGFILFFVYKYKVFKQRAEFIEQMHLIEKINNNDPLDDNDRKGLSIILCKIMSNKERINFFFIFIASFVALILAIYFDFIR